MAAGSTHSVRPSRSERGLSSIFRKAAPATATTAKDEVDDDWAADDLIFNEYPHGAHRPFTRSSSFPTQQRLSTIPTTPTTVAASRAASRAAQVEYAPHPGAMSDLWPSLDEITSHHSRTPNSKKRASTLPTPTAMAPGMSGPSPYDKGAAALAQFQAGQAVPNPARSTALPSPRQSMLPSPRQSMVPSPLQSVVPLPKQQHLQQAPETPPPQPQAFANGSVPTTSQTFANGSSPTMPASQSFSNGWDMKASRRAPPPPLRLPVPASPRRTNNAEA
ncbi:uncharacterized protein LOC62_03G004084 [Vanrija pseudolonga]|uniref:Uncharacterized protein n=1 Tax=Vanrija pseudolonga TaxID=143232 RepID=A0AAF0YA96_9TREE|nr:hypothetical protein LOC62_03G004084 [Vanrija pseudolonga]